MNRKRILIVGDVAVFVILTIVGFASHGEAGTSFLPRMGAAFFPVIFAWFVLAPWFGLFDEAVISNPLYLLRIPLAFLFVAPLAVILRGAWLNAAAQPLFALVFGGTNALGMMVWRLIFSKINSTTPRSA